VVTISDSGPLIRFAEVDQFDLLRQVFSELIIPPAVYDEVVRQSLDLPGAREVAEAPWIRQQVPTVQSESRWFPPALGRREVEVLRLTLELPDVTVALLDDLPARRHAGRIGVPFMGSAGVLILAKQLELISQVAPILNMMRSSRLRISDDAVREVLDAANELLDDSHP
jgi:predicted nucleic acid-binding protein